jgi:hypothetical protein
MTHSESAIDRPAGESKRDPTLPKPVDLSVEPWWLVQQLFPGTSPERAEWIANLDKVAALEPTIVVAGHERSRQERSKGHWGIRAICAGFLADRRR